MDIAEIRSRIKQIVGNVAGLDPATIGDDAALQEDLNLDSLSLLEIGVDVDLAFHLGLPDERYKDIGSLPEMVALVEQCLSGSGAQPELAFQ